MSELVSILMPMYNAELSIRKAIESCINQSHSHLEILILDNGSTDRSSEVIKSITDTRIRLIKSESNIGIAAGRNRLLKEAKGSYIAWLDADDAMLPNRIETQLEFFKNHADIDILGTWILVDQSLVKTAPVKHTHVSAMLWFKNCIFQPSVMSRNFYKQENIFYDESYLNSVEDYELWYRLMKTKRFGNIDNAYTYYHQSTGEALNAKKLKGNFDANLNRLWSVKWKEISIDISENDKKLFQHFLYNNEALNDQEINSLLKTLETIEQHFSNYNHSLICSFHRLRIWRNANAFGKIKHLHLLSNILKYSAIKKMHFH